MGEVTVIIPTKNRSKFVSAQLLWYSREPDIRVIVADSSDPADFHRNAALCRTLSTTAEHLDCRGVNEQNSTLQALKITRTAYVIWSGDDDFISPQGLRILSYYLNTNAGVSCVGGFGYRIHYDLDENFAGNRHGLFRLYPQPEALGPSPESRILHYSSAGNGGDMHYCLYRVDEKLQTYIGVENIEDRYLGAAWYPILMTLVMGEVHRLPVFTVLKGIHTQRHKESVCNVQRVFSQPSLVDLNHLIANIRKALTFHGLSASIQDEFLRECLFLIFMKEFSLRWGHSYNSWTKYAKLCVLYFRGLCYRSVALRNIHRLRMLSPWIFSGRSKD